MNTPALKEIRTQTLAARMLAIMIRRDNLIAQIDLGVLMGTMTPKKAAELKARLR